MCYQCGHLGFNPAGDNLCKKEKEILFEPFTFCHVKDVVFDVKKYTADIYLETIGKTEILENAIKNGKKIEYNKELNIMEIK